MKLLLNIISSAWSATVAMGPYMLLGLVVAGILHVVLPRQLVEKHLKRRGFASIFKATLIGIPLPLCSCSVIPVTASLRQHGCSKGAAVSFLLATPQTGADSVMATYGVLGPVFAVFRVMVALLTGLLGGWLTDCFDSDAARPLESPALSEPPTQPVAAWWRRALRHACLTLPRDFSLSMLLGLLLAGIISAFMPAQFLSGKLGNPTLEIVVAIAFGIPMYVCATGSIPIAASLIAAGVSPGAALAFLISGPASNAATITTLWKSIGHRATGIYILVIVVVSFAAGLVLNAIPCALPVVPTQLCQGCGMCDMGPVPPSIWAVVGGVVFLGLLVVGAFRKLRG